MARLYECVYCGYDARALDYMFAHIQTSHPEQLNFMEYYVCAFETCDYLSSNFGELIRHFFSHPVCPCGFRLCGCPAQPSGVAENRESESCQPRAKRSCTSAFATVAGAEASVKRLRSGLNRQESVNGLQDNAPSFTGSLSSTTQYQIPIRKVIFHEWQGARINSNASTTASPLCTTPATDNFTKENYH